MKQETAKILWNAPAGQSVYRIGLSCSSEYEKADPGQFVSLRLAQASSPLLRRPFSIHRLIKKNGEFGGIEILYKAVGEFTRKLSRATAGERIDVLGPLGKGFTVSGAVKNAALVAGGIGVAPMIFLAEKLIYKDINPAQAIACLGGRSADDIICAAEFQSMEIETYMTSEDGSIGEKGLVTDALSGWLKEHQPDMIYACGPMPMLSAVSAISRKYRLPCEVSIETIMACGVGACLGCAIKDTQHEKGYGHVCIDGPVFNAARLKLTDQNQSNQNF